MSFPVLGCDFCKTEEVYQAENFLSKDKARARARNIGAIFPWSVKTVRGVNPPKNKPFSVSGIITKRACVNCFRDPLDSIENICDNTSTEGGFNV